MTKALFREDAYARRCDATVTSADAEAVILDRTVFYPLGGGQPGDRGRLRWPGGELRIIDTRHSEGGIRHLPEPGQALPPAGTRVEAEIDWDRRYRHMRMHTALHLLGAVLPYGVTGGNIGTERSRLDFDMEEPVDKDAVTKSLQNLVDADYPVRTRWITDEELTANPELVRTLSVQPPRGTGRVRLLEIGDVDLQPCGGTHLRSTSEIGRITVAKVEKKGRRNRRVYIELADGPV